LTQDTPRSRSGNKIDTIDWHLDLIVEPDMTSRWKDEDEAEAALAAGHLTQAELTTARATGDAILCDLSGWLELIGDWRTFLPPQAWEAPLDLPDDWNS
jgi:predicted RNA-binding protein associated with RNAse of E/G family